MASYSQRDQQMLTEAYTVQLLKESIPDMTLKQVFSNLDLMTESELVYVSTVSERLLEGFFGNIGSGLRNVGKGISQGASDVAGRASQAVGDKVGQAVQGARQLGSGLAAGAREIRDNTSNMYNKGVVDKQAGDAIIKAKSSIEQLKKLILQAQDNNILSKNFDPMQISLSELIDNLEGAKTAASTNSQNVLNRGFTSGAKQAFMQSMKS